MTDGRGRGAESAVLGIDLGTTELKALLVGPDGALLAAAGRGYPLDADPASGRAEQDPETWWSALREVVRELRAAVRVEIAGIAVVGQGPTLVASDADARPTHPAVTWLDSRSGREASELEQAAGIGGWALGPLPAALRIERTSANAAHATRWYLNSWEWLSFRLTGVAATTMTQAQILVDPAQVDRIGLPEAKLAPRVPAASRFGGLTAESSADLGLAPGTPVVAGTVDAYGSVLGAGLVDPGDAIDTGGTSGGFGVVWDEPIVIGGSYAAPAPLPGRWLYGGAMSSTGKALDWLRDSILGGAAGTASPSTVELLAEASAVPPGADGVVFLPYLAGERAPLWDPTARGAFCGLSLRHRRAHLVRAVLEAAAMALRHVAAPIREAGIEVREVRVSGGPARSPFWNQIKADVLGVPVAVPSVRETAGFGAALIAAVGTGAQRDLEQAVRRLVAIESRVEPDPIAGSVYDEVFAAYVDLHPAIAPVIRRLHGAGRELGFAAAPDTLVAAG